MDTSTHKAVAELPAENPALTFSPDGSLLVASAAYRTGQMMKVWNVASQNPVVSFTVPGAFATFSADGTVLAVGNGGNVDLWDTKTHAQFGTIPASVVQGKPSVGGSPVNGQPLAFDGNGLLAMGAGRGANTVQLWNIPYLNNTTSYLCRLANQPFPPAAWKQYASGLQYARTCP